MGTTVSTRPDKSTPHRRHLDEGTGAGTTKPRQQAPRRYPAATRALALRIYEDTKGTATSVARILEAEHGETVNVESVRYWIARASRANETPSIGGLADRTLALLSSELKRLERVSPSKLDLDRLAKVAQTLKTLDGLRARGTSRNEPRKLEDLNAEATSSNVVEPRNAETFLAPEDAEPIPLSQLEDLETLGG